jgi:hypothetical protein
VSSELASAHDRLRHTSFKLYSRDCFNWLSESQEQSDQVMRGFSSACRGSLQRITGYAAINQHGADCHLEPNTGKGAGGRAFGRTPKSHAESSLGFFAGLFEWLAGLNSDPDATVPALLREDD